MNHIYALVLFLATDNIPRISWYATAEECRTHAAVQAFHYQIQGHQIEWSGCQAVRRDTLRPVRIEFDTRPLPREE